MTYSYTAAHPPGHTGTLSGTAVAAPSFLQPQPLAPPTTGEGNSPTPTASTLGQPAATTGHVPVQTPSTSKDKEDLTLPISGLPPIPAHMVEAIKARQFVALGDLLPEALRDAAFDRQSKDLKEEKRKRSPPLSNPTDWMCAYATYMAVTVHFHPERAFEMAAYGHIIAGLARDIGGQAWSRYDRTFRQAAAVNHQLPWSKREQDIWLQAACEPSHGVPLATTIRSPSVQTTLLPATRPPLQAGAPQPRRLPSPEPCRLWNNGRCTFLACRYRHACWYCSAPTHVGPQCPLQQQKGTWASNRHLLAKP